MPTPPSCVRCSGSLAVDSGSGLCQTCQSAGDTSRNPAPIIRTASSNDAPDATASLGGPPHATASFRPAVPDTTPYQPAASETPGFRFERLLGGPTTGKEENPPQWADRPPDAPTGYVLMGRLGRGGMGDVYLARDVTADRLVAMKFLTAPNNATAVERFQKELQALARLSHPNIVRMLGHDFYRSLPYFVMEYAPGGTLSQRIVRDGPLDPKEGARFLSVAARAVHAAHAANILHRDLKPSNILLAEDGTVRVSDFGLAKRTDQDDDLTAGSGALGTPGYMPPEQTRRGAIDPRADVYGLGATLYHLLTGRPPFVGPQADVLRDVVDTPPTRPRALKPEIPLAVEAVVMKCLEKSPADRYPTAAAVADALDRFLAGKDDTGAPQLTRWRRVRRWAAWHRVKLAAASALLAAGAGLVIAGSALAPTVQPGGTDNRPLAAPPPAPDPATEVLNELVAGNRVVLVGETGQPRWHAWRLTPGTLAESPLADGTCSFQTNDATLLELLPDPGIDCYRVSAEIRQLRRVVPDGLPNGIGTDRVGLYFGADAQVAGGNRRVTTLIGAVFNDVPRGAKAGKPPPPNGLRVDAESIVQAGDQLPRGPTEGLAGLPFVPAAQWPGAWRQILMEVTPDAVEVFWKADPNDARPPQSVWRESRNNVRACYAGFKPRLARLTPDAGPVAPDWRPRSPIGILCRQSSVAIRNVIVEPILP